jgi:hypothetical protein
VRLATAHRPGTRLVLTGTTGVCGDAQGGAVDEDGPLDPAAAGLIAIEQAALAHGDACVLRLPALVGDGRDRLVARARACLAQGVPFTVPGDPDRPFSVIHEADAAGLAVEALVGRLADVRGVLHAAAPGCRTVRAWYTHHLRAAGIDLAIVSDGTVRPSRAISANRLWARLPDWPWRTPF